MIPFSLRKLLLVLKGVRKHERSSEDMLQYFLPRITKFILKHHLGTGNTKCNDPSSKTAHHMLRCFTLVCILAFLRC